MKLIKIAKNPKLLVASFLSLFVFGLCDNIRGPLFPEILKELSLSDSKGAFFFAVASFMALPGGYLTTYFIFPKYKEKRSFLLGMATLAIGMLAVGQSHSFTFLMFAVSILGFSFGILGVMQNYLVLSSAHDQYLNQSQAALHTMYGAASFIAPVFANIIYKISPHWQSVFTCSGLFALIFVCYYWNKNFGSPTASEKVSTTKLQNQFINTKLKSSLKFHLQCVYYSTFLALYVVGELVVGTRLSLFLRRIYEMDLSLSSIYTAYFFGLLLTGRFLFIFIKTKIPTQIQLICALILSISTLYLGIHHHYLWIILSGLMMAPIYPLAMSYSTTVFTDRITEVMSAVVACTAFAVVSMHLSFGFITDSIGIHAAMMIGVFSLVLSLILFLLLPKVCVHSKKYNLGPKNV